MLNVAVASTNPVKIESVRQAFQAVFPQEEIRVDGVKTETGVGDQPMSDEETIRGARNRIVALRKIVANADYYAGLEGGIEKVNGKTFAFAWAVIESGQGKIGEARTASHMLPPVVAKLIDEGVELGEANDRVFGMVNSKQKNGALGILTNDLVTRTSEYRTTVILALNPFGKYAKLYD